MFHTRVGHVRIVYNNISFHLHPYVKSNFDNGSFIGFSAMSRSVVFRMIVFNQYGSKVVFRMEEKFISVISTESILAHWEAHLQISDYIWINFFINRKLLAL